MCHIDTIYCYHIAMKGGLTMSIEPSMESDQEKLCQLYKEEKQQQRIKDKFWDNVYIDINGGCWEWLLSKDTWGYGQASLNKKYISAHRLSWILHYGDIPKKLCVCHKCDNPPCVNPDHLFLGTDADNVHDKIAKGKGNEGEKHGNVKLTNDKIMQIRKSNLSGRKLAILYGVTFGNISHIKRYKSWKNLPRSPIGEHG